MALAKRIFLFLLLNFFVVITISIVLNLLHVGPFLTPYGLDIPSLLIFSTIWGMGGALISLALSRVTAKWIMGVKTVDPNTKDPELRDLVSTIHRLCQKAGVPFPEIGVFRSNEVNAFATGPSRKRSLVAVSTGLLQRMKESEVEAVLGHEISHIANGDMVTMTLLQGVVNAFVICLARILASLLSGFGRREQGREQGGSYGGYVAFTLIFETVFMLLGSLVIAAYSRFREFRADAGGARLAGREAMIEALQTLRALQEVRDPKETPAMAALKISHPAKKGFLALFATHPPLEERIERLQSIR